jgi:small subunit ribosomal protein S14
VLQNTDLTQATLLRTLQRGVLSKPLLFYYLLLLYTMAKKSMIARETKRQRLVHKYAEKRTQFKQDLRHAGSIREVVAIHRQFQMLPRNSAPVRLHNRCIQTGRPKGYYRDFGLSRHVLREMAHQCLLPGMRKSSW